MRTLPSSFFHSMYLKKHVFFYCLMQLMALCGLLWLCNQAVALLHWHIPGSVLGLGILVLLLLTHVVPERAIQAGSSWLLGELLLFFIPPVVSILKYQVFIRDDGWMIAGTVVLGTLSALVVTAWVVDRLYTLEKGINDRRLARASHRENKKNGIGGQNHV
ncbi:Holin-like protein CidA [Marinomonas spartinae]|uniref:Holin-like protein CidA n=1 Tax=Marinomonas spartinae TaxID=1792290 RepID=A0A1A8T1L5_9GAMM|nr:CidA/LrgA family protein [Marinomonas spartinae]SBS25845.1 Holin-like protein CidA [Marinomonas spartinae]SBS39787.1 Holin-like protein CidA [Marinomonas spartinae]